jgi:hypothetical protein
VVGVGVIGAGAGIQEDTAAEMEEAMGAEAEVEMLVVVVEVMGEEDRVVMLEDAVDNETSAVRSSANWSRYFVYTCVERTYFLFLSLFIDKYIILA